MENRSHHMCRSSFEKQFRPLMNVKLRCNLVSDRSIYPVHRRLSVCPSVVWWIRKRYTKIEINRSKGRWDRNIWALKISNNSNLVRISFGLNTEGYIERKKKKWKMLQRIFHHPSMISLMFEISDKKEENGKWQGNLVAVLRRSTHNAMNICLLIIPLEEAKVGPGKVSTSGKSNRKPSIMFSETIFHVKENVTFRPVDEPSQLHFLGRIQRHLMHLILGNVWKESKWHSTWETFHI